MAADDRGDEHGAKKQPGLTLKVDIPSPTHTSAESMKIRDVSTDVPQTSGWYVVRHVPDDAEDSATHRCIPHAVAGPADTKEAAEAIREELAAECEQFATTVMQPSGLLRLQRDTCVEIVKRMESQLAQTLCDGSATTLQQRALLAAEQRAQGAGQAAESAERAGDPQGVDLQELSSLREENERLREALAHAQAAAATAVTPRSVGAAANATQTRIAGAVSTTPAPMIGSPARHRTTTPQPVSVYSEYSHGSPGRGVASHCGMTNTTCGGTTSPRGLAGRGTEMSRAWLIGHVPPHRKYPILCEEGALFTIGRAPACSMQVTGGADVSRVHCAVRYTREPAPQCAVFDLASRNGLLVNGVRVAGHTTLKHGDQIALQAVDVALHFTFCEQGGGGRRSSPMKRGDAARPGSVSPAGMPSGVGPSYDQAWRKDTPLVYRAKATAATARAASRLRSRPSSAPPSLRGPAEQRAGAPPRRGVGNGTARPAATRLTGAGSRRASGDVKGAVPRGAAGATRQTSAYTRGAARAARPVTTRSANTDTIRRVGSKGVKGE